MSIMSNMQDKDSGSKGVLVRGISRLRSRMGIFAWGAVVVFLIQRGNDIGNIVCKIFLGRILPPMDFGAVEPVFATISILSLPAVIIFSTAVKSISRLQSQGLHAQCRALIYDLQRIAVGGSILSILVIFFLKDFILTRLHLESSIFIWMIAIMFVVSWWAPLIQSIIRAEHRYRLLFFGSILGPSLLVSLTFLLVGPLSLGLQGAVVAKVFANVIMVALLMVFIHIGHRGDREPYTKERLILVKMLIPMSIMTFSTALAVNFDRLFVRNFMIEHSAGLSAIFMLGQIPRMIIMPIGFVIFPVAAAEHASGRKLGRLLRRSSLICVLAIAVFSFVFYIIATPLLSFWRPEFEYYGQYVWIYALISGLNALNSVVAQIEMARHEYGFLWFYATPILLVCLGLYIAQDYMKLPVTLSIVLWALAATQMITFITTAGYISLRRRV